MTCNLLCFANSSRAARPTLPTLPAIKASKVKIKLSGILLKLSKYTLIVNYKTIFIHV